MPGTMSANLESKAQGWRYLGG